MKFVCMTCDTQMKSVESRRQPAEGTLSAVPAPVSFFVRRCSVRRVALPTRLRR